MDKKIPIEGGESLLLAIVMEQRMRQRGKEEEAESSIARIDRGKKRRNPEESKKVEGQDVHKV